MSGCHLLSPSRLTLPAIAGPRPGDACRCGSNRTASERFSSPLPRSFPRRRESRGPIADAHRIRPHARMRGHERSVCLKAIGVMVRPSPPTQTVIAGFNRAIHAVAAAIQALIVSALDARLRGHERSMASHFLAGRNLEEFEAGKMNTGNGLSCPAKKQCEFDLAPCGHSRMPLGGFHRRLK